jgi:hypothetical protein
VICLTAATKSLKTVGGMDLPHSQQQLLMSSCERIPCNVHSLMKEVEKMMTMEKVEEMVNQNPVEDAWWSQEEG